MSLTLGLSDLAIVFATLMGPVLAVQVQRLVDRSRSRSDRRIAIFRTLMTTRVAALSQSHVEALNAIPIEFYGRSRPFRDVMDAWREYLDYLSQRGIDPAVWAQKRYDLFTDLLWRLGKAVGYHFTKVELQREVYSPQAHATMEVEQEVIRRGLYRIFNGETAFPLDIKSFPADPSVLNMQKEIQKHVLAWVTGQQSVKVETTSPAE